MRYLAIDFGLRRLGLAISDDSGRLASPYAVRERRGTKADVADIITTLRGLGAQALLVGRPRSTQEGQTGDSERAADAFVKALENALRAANVTIPIERWDERFSTREALGQLREVGISQKRGRGDSGSGGVDARAAAIILQGFLDAQQQKKHPQSDDVAEAHSHHEPVDL